MRVISFANNHTGEQTIVTIKNRISGGKTRILLNLENFKSKKSLKKDLLRQINIDEDYKGVRVQFRLNDSMILYVLALFRRTDL